MKANGEGWLEYASEEENDCLRALSGCLDALPLMIDRSRQAPNAAAEISHELGERGK